MNTPNGHELIEKLDGYIAILSRLYSQSDDLKHIQVMLDNCKASIDNHCEYDNLDGGMYGHIIHLTIPNDIYIDNKKSIKQIQDIIKEDINEMSNIHNEYVYKLFIDPDVNSPGNWKKNTEHLGDRLMLPDNNTIREIWGEGEYRIFISHKAEEKITASNIKNTLEQYGISCFVAHEDIKPTREWINIIESALTTMDMLVALMTKDFHNSNWTDQEIGFAMGRNVPIIAIKLGLPPYGFIGKYQALSAKKSEIHSKLLQILMKKQKAIDALITATEKCMSFDQGNNIAGLFEHIENISIDQASRLVHAHNNNNQASESFGFKGSHPSTYGKGLLHYLQIWTGKEYVQHGRIIEIEE